MQRPNLRPWLTVLALFVSIGSGLPALAHKAAVPADPGANRFGFHLLQTLQHQKPDTNLFFSPVSISLAFNMVANGASGGTKTAMAQALEQQGRTLEEVNRDNAALLAELERFNSGVVLTIADSLWVRKGMTLRPDFQERCRQAYQAEAGPLTGGAQQINDWVAAQTRDKIKEVITDQEIAGAELMLVNSVFFHAEWKTPFDDIGQGASFVHADGSEANCSLMYQANTFSYLRAEGFQAISLPYQREQFSMIVVLPDKPEGLSALAAHLTPTVWERWMAQMKPAEGDLHLPQFELTSEVNLISPLTEMGMGIAFTGQADFSGLSPQPLHISFARHKTFLIVDRKGTTAAAATAVGITRGGFPRSSGFHMRVDHPFLCAIRDNTTGALLFLGAIYDPEPGKAAKE